MDTVSRERRGEVVSRILDGWGLDALQKAKILDDEDRALCVLSIHESLQCIYSDSPERALQWPHRPNREFGDSPPLDEIVGGDIEKVKKYLRYHCYNA
nr:hypothetical protein [uncultured Marinobacter sp.]